MGLFAKYKAEGSEEQTSGPALRTEKVLKAAKPSSRTESPVPQHQTKPARPSPLTLNRASRPSKSTRAVRRPLSRRPILESDSSDELSSDERPVKRRRVSGEIAPSPASERQLWAETPLNGSLPSDAKPSEYISASTIASLQKPKAYAAVFPESEHGTSVVLQYPGSDQGET